jgi:hypothetical protein
LLLAAHTGACPKLYIGSWELVERSTGSLDQGWVIGMKLNNVNNPPQSRMDKDSNVNTPVRDRKDKNNSFGAHPFVERPFLFCRSGGNPVLPPNSLLPIPGTLGMSNRWGLPQGMGSKRFPRTKCTFQNRGTFLRGPGNMGCKTTAGCYAGIP